MARTTKSLGPAEVTRLRKALDREKAKSAALAKERAEAREQHAAAAEILKIISRSPSDTQPVFDAIVQRACRLLGGHSALVTRLADGMLQLAAHTSTSRAGDAAIRKAYPRSIADAGANGQAIRTRAASIIRDTEGVPKLRETARTRGYRSFVAVPLLCRGAAIGSLAVSRKEPGTFSRHEIHLLNAFADQAVIAIENVRLFNETKEALERQTATAEILKVIASSPSDVQPVFDAIAASARRLLRGVAAHVNRVDGDSLHLVALTASNPAADKAVRDSYPRPLSGESMSARAVRTRKPVWRAESQSDPRVSRQTRELARKRGYESNLVVPMLRAGTAIGTIAVARRESGAFSSHHIELLRTFADQAVIAVENVRLFNETKDALERQTATAEVLQVISQSPTDVQPVLDVIAERAARLCGATDALILTVEGGMLHRRAHFGPIKSVSSLRPLTHNTPSGRAILEHRTIHVEDILVEIERGDYPEARELQRGTGFRTMLSVPLVREDSVIGVIGIRRLEVRPFTEKQIALVKTFADQAVIAIENVRLFNETKEALERQTATAEILKVIASSPTDVQPVFDVIVERAVKLCGARFGRVYRYDGAIIQMVAGHGLSSAGLQQVQRVFPRPAADDTIVGRVVGARQPYFVRDIQHDAAVPMLSRQMMEALNTRSQVTIPMQRAGEPIGAITMGWDQPDGFDDRTVALLQTFADQAVIAIQNVRLFNETQEALEQQTATAGILRVISSSPTTVQPVFEAILEHALRLCEASFGYVSTSDGDAFDLAAQQGLAGEALAEALKAFHETRIPGPQTALGRLRANRQAVHILDVKAEPAYRARDPRRVAIVELAGARTMLAMPLLKEGDVIGAVVIYRREVRAFTEKQMSLLRTFADQAVIAIQNVRLFNETKEALERQTATAEILKVIASSPSDVQPVFDAIAASAMRLIGGLSAAVARLDGEMLHLAAFTTTSEDGDEAIRSTFPRPLSDPSNFVTAMRNQAPRWIEDTETSPDVPPDIKALARARGWRSSLATPMMRGTEAIGVINVTRIAPGTFSDHQVGLLKTFADQAVIAIENVRLFNETKEALERQTATAAILHVLGGSMTDTQPVFEAIVKNCHDLFKNSGVMLRLAADGQLHVKAHVDYPTLGSLPIDRTSAAGVCMVEGRIIHLTNLEEAAREFPRIRQLGLKHGYRSGIFAPLMRGGQAIGIISVMRRELGAFGDKDVQLLKTFADQAVIAIENVRLFNETKEALERQTATAEILRVISNSPTSVQPVFQAIVDSALRVLACTGAAFLRREGDAFRLVAMSSSDPAFTMPANPRPIPIDPSGNFPSRVFVDKAMLHIPDWSAIELPPHERGVYESLGVRSSLMLPLLREDGCIGVLTVTRSIARAYTGKEIALMQTFADQAVIAIENVRLFNETQEALARQEAASQVLRSISESVSDTAPVFTAILDCCNRLIPSIDYVQVQLIEGADRVSLVDHRFGQVRGAAPGKQEERKAELMAREAAHFPRPLAGSTLERALNQGRVVILADTLDGPDTPPATLVEARRWGHSYSQITVPLMREGRCIGAIEAFRRRLGGFEAKESSLLESFADQAVIAIENVRLFNETKESLERQTATAEILKVIASSPSDVQPVFDAIAASARRLLGGHAANVARRAGDVLELAAFTSTGEAGDSEISRLWPAKITGKGHMGKALLSKAPAWVEDIETEPGYSEEFRAGARARGMRSAVSVPMLREGEAIGVISVNRSVPGRFSDHQTNLLQTFADQAVIAIENVRLFNETKESLERQTATGEILKVIASSPSDAQPVFDTIVQSGLKLFPDAAIGVALPEGGVVRAAAVGTTDPAMSAAWKARFPFPLKREYMHGLAILDRRMVDIPDAEAQQEGRLAPGITNFLASGYRAITIMPMMKSGEAIGAISVLRLKPGALSDKQLELLRTFADQAVIAIENVRLFKELEARTEALSKSVGQLTALGEVGQAVSSTLDLEMVLKTIATRAVQLTGLDGASIYEYDEASEEFRLQAADNLAHELVEAVRRAPIRKGDGTVGMTAITLEPTQVPDIMDPHYQSSRKELLIKAGYRAVLTVPLLRDDHIIGALSVSRKTPGAFAPEIVELLKTFATQSAMAIQNARLFREIAEKGKQLEEASKHKSHFLASMSHELRTPLNAILGFNEMILGDVYGEVPADMKEPLTDIQSSGKHLLRLINNVLDLAKIEAGRMELALADYSVQDTVESVRSTLRPLAAEKGLEFVVTVPADIPLAYGDSGRITQCLMNLAGNSLKFTKTGKVEISVEQDNGRLTYRVADTGIGIPPEKIASLFTEFKQTDATIASEYGGTGLGLSISKKFIEMHGGRIWVESEVGSGSRFIFEVPLRAGEGKTA